MPKRYVLLLAGEEISDAGLRALRKAVGRRLGDLKVISVKGNSRAVIIRTDEPGARAIRSEGVLSAPGGLRLTPVLTSGAIGNLKRRAEEAASNGEVHE